VVIGPLSLGEKAEDDVWPVGVTPTQSFLAILDHIRRERDNIFVTGRAGTGKSTLLRGLVKSLDGEVVIGAPTAIVALNIGGDTLHSLFRVAWDGVLLDGDEASGSPRPIFELEDVTLIIDEVSMVRADLLNAMDVGLREKRGKDMPFGGVRVIAFGDTHQLPPVSVSAEVTARLNATFGGSCFFNAPAAQSMSLIELTEVFRQNDPDFLALLNEVRDGNVSDGALAAINSRVGARPNEDAEAWVWICATNNATAEVNRRFLARLPGEIRTYCATVSGEFQGLSSSGRDHRNVFSGDLELTLKKGARVIFIRNDRHRRWVNGTTGIITGLDENEIEVRLTGGDSVTVGIETWTKKRRVKIGKEVREEELGSIAQLPVRLGWAVTIHKCQGMTLDRLFLNTPHRLFASGQCYVALSRVRSFAGLRLLRPLTRRDIFLSPDALGYRSLLRSLPLEHLGEHA
jgi:ATP-dependent exoDNAse (exonuclease V) alpha subunit